MRCVRVVLVTGKGGVGKTTLAAATALAAADRGARTLLVSTDAAHSLGDVLATRLDAEPTPVAPNVDGVHLDGRRELERSWGIVADYLRRLLGWADLDRLHVDELVVVPGLDHLLALAALRGLVEDGRWDAVVVDCAPSADSLRLLTLPDVLRWYIDRLVGRNGLLSGWARRRVERTLAVPPPGDEVISSVTDLTDELSRLRDTLAAAVTTARIVVTPERVVVAEAQRTLAYLALYGYAVDAILVNRVPGPALGIPALEPWVRSQETQLGVIRDTLLAAATAEGAAPAAGADRRRSAPLRGRGAVRRARSARRRCRAALALEITTDGDESFVRVPVNGVDRRDIQVERSFDELVLTLGEYRRNVRLPDRLRDQEVVRAGLIDGNLEVVFGSEASRVG